MPEHLAAAGAAPADAALQVRRAWCCGSRCAPPPHIAAPSERCRMRMRCSFSTSKDWACNSPLVKTNALGLPQTKRWQTWGCLRLAGDAGGLPGARLADPYHSVRRTHHRHGAAGGRHHQRRHHRLPPPPPPPPRCRPAAGIAARSKASSPGAMERPNPLRAGPCCCVASHAARLWRCFIERLRSITAAGVLPLLLCCGPSSPFAQ